jgi:hypothetical protein
MMYWNMYERSLHIFDFQGEKMPSKIPTLPPRAAHRPAYVIWMLCVFRSIKLLEQNSGNMMRRRKKTKPAQNKRSASWCAPPVMLKNEDGEKSNKDEKGKHPKSRKRTFDLAFGFLFLHTPSSLQYWST